MMNNNLLLLCQGNSKLKRNTIGYIPYVLYGRSLLDESQHFVGDLSVILDELISGHSLPVDIDSPAPGQGRRDNRTSSASVVNSTRIDHQQALGSKDTSHSPAKCEESEIEDSFDRMCH